jgi:hypothetical protein
VNEAALATCRAFLDTLDPKIKDGLLHFLSHEALTELQRARPLSGDVTKGIPPLHVELTNIHGTWIAPFLRALPNREIALFLSTLSGESIEEVKSLLLFTNHIPTPSPLGRVFLRSTLMRMLSKKNRITPPVCLPAHPLNTLLAYRSEKIMNFIDLLSMHDLAVEMRAIIRATTLKAIQEALTKPQRTLLQTIIHAKEPVIFRYPLLKNWSEDTKILQARLRERGMNRLAKALTALHPDFLWHLAHHLDVKHGEQLISLSTPLDTPRASELLVKQAISLLKSLE